MNSLDTANSIAEMIKSMLEYKYNAKQIHYHDLITLTFSLIYTEFLKYWFCFQANKGSLSYLMQYFSQFCFIF